MVVVIHIQYTVSFPDSQIFWIMFYIAEYALEYNVTKNCHLTSHIYYGGGGNYA